MAFLFKWRIELLEIDIVVHPWKANRSKSILLRIITPNFRQNISREISGMPGDRLPKKIMVIKFLESSLVKRFHSIL